ncbi:DUF2291 family protein [Tessaracoccus sp. Z1128]
MQSSGTIPLWKRPALSRMAIMAVILVAILAGTRFYAPGTEPFTDAVVDSDVVSDPVAYAQASYDAEVVPAIEAKAVELPTLLDALAADEGSAEDYGFRNGGSPYSFPVRVTGTVVEGSFGEVGLEVEGVSDVTVGVQTGPAVTGTAIRDATGLMTFEMFLNQIDFASVATELNNRVKETVLSETDFDSLLGQEVTVLGAFTHDNETHVKITPISIETVS